MSAPVELLDRLGGRDGIGEVARVLYDRLLADDEIGVKFSDAHLPQLRERLTDYLAEACSGTHDVAGARLRAAHAEHDVGDRDFSIMASHLADVLDDLGVDADASADLLDLVAARRADVVASSHVADEWDPIDGSSSG